MSREKEKKQCIAHRLLLKGFSLEKHYLEIFVEIKIFSMARCKEMETSGWEQKGSTENNNLNFSSDLFSCWFVFRVCMPLFSLCKTHMRSVAEIRNQNNINNETRERVISTSHDNLATTKLLFSTGVWRKPWELKMLFYSQLIFRFA